MSIQWPDERSESKRLYDRAEKVMPGGITRVIPWVKPFPVYAQRGEGAYVYDADGTRRLDLLNNFASLLHGHAHPKVVEAVRHQVGLGTAFTLPTEAEVVLAETICERAKSFEWVRFSNSGTEAVMAAIKAARALTGRPKIVKIEGAYHGAYDYAEVSLDSPPEGWGNEPASIGYSRGAPAGMTQDVIVIPFNDVETAERIIRRNRESIAGILIEAAPSNLGFPPVSKPFADMVERVSKEIGAVFILDEVITFRVHRGGLQSLMGITPDITVLAKIIGGGFPVGAVAGRREVMSVFDHRNGKPPLPWSGTFTANPVTMTAGKVTLDMYGEEDVQRLDRLTQRLVDGVRAAIEHNGFPGQISSLSSCFMFFGHGRTVTDYRSGYQTVEERALVERLQAAMIREGYLIARNGKGFLSTVMVEEDIDGFVDAFDRIASRGV